MLMTGQPGGRGTHSADVVAHRNGSADAALVLALRAGEARAFDAIWSRYSALVSRFFARSVGWSLPDVDDLTQEVFLSLFLVHRTIEKPASLRHFVMSVTRYVLKQHLRSRRARQNVVLSLTGEIPDVATPAGSEERAREARLALGRCDQILDGIRTRERTAFLLRYLEGMSVDEIADRLEVSRSTVKRLISRAATKFSSRVGRAQILEASCAETEDAWPSKDSTRSVLRQRSSATVPSAATTSRPALNGRG
jgi:RNA polymerase sigma-70 factor, ECF subfamily